MTDLYTNVHMKAFASPKVARHVNLSGCFIFTDSPSSEMLTMSTSSHNTESEEIEKSSNNWIDCTANSSSQQTLALNHTRTGLYHFLATNVVFAFILPF